MKPLRTFSVVFALLTSPPVTAGDYVWLIGGGYHPDSSQAQIEQNVLWVSQLVRQLPGQRTLRIYFDDGNDPAPDVQELVPLAGTDGLESLRRLFAHGHVAGYYYRNHTLSPVDGGTERAALVTKLEREMAGLRPGDRLLVVFNGHGTRNRRDANASRLWLWQGTSLDVRAFDALLAHVPPAVSVRFVFTQCYAGAFARLAPGPDANRCGFLAESEDQQAEGCAAGVDANDYRDYTTYFFAALAGRTRLGEPLSVNPDLDGDGRVSLYEAHLYALREGESADLPRATSEVFLERWQPWYADWRDLFSAGRDALPDNLYGRLARVMEQKLDLPADATLQRRTLRQRRVELQARARTLQRQQRARLRRIQSLQHDIRQAVGEHYPALDRLSHQDILAGTGEPLREVAAAVAAHPGYADLAETQDAHATGESELLANERALTQLDKAKRLRRLARLSDRFVSEASERDRTAYETLQACERQGL